MIEFLDEGGEGRDVEVAGYLQKKTSRGFFINRYFRTYTHYLRYWQEKAQFEQQVEPSESFDICEVKNLEKTHGGRVLCLFFMNDKFKLELKAASERDCSEWYEIILAKKSLYSTTELLAELAQDEVKFVTEAFRTLMTLKERDKNKFLLDRLDEVFQSATEGLSVNDAVSVAVGAPGSQSESALAAAEDGLRTEPLRLMRAAAVAMEEFRLTCEDCAQEIASRHPKIIAHCRLQLLSLYHLQPFYVVFQCIATFTLTYTVHAFHG